jgi:hypothetical protein
VVHDREEEGSQDLKADVPKLPTPPAGELSAPLKGLSQDHDAGPLVAVKWAAVLAPLADEAGAVAYPHASAAGNT